MRKKGNHFDPEYRSLIYQQARSVIHRKRVKDEEINWVLNALPLDCDRALGLRYRLMCKKSGMSIDWPTVNMHMKNSF